MYSGSGYRDFDNQGMTAGGPMYTIERGLGIKWRWLAIIFACFAVICSFATGNAIQSFTLSDQLYSEVSQLVGTEHFLTIKHQLTDWFSVSIQQIINGIFIAGIAGLVIIGGIKRIGNVTSFLAPIMAAIYFLAAMLILVANIGDIPASFGRIISMAFNPPAAVGGVAGGTLLVIMNTMLWGVKRGSIPMKQDKGVRPLPTPLPKQNSPSEKVSWPYWNLSLIRLSSVP